MLVNYCTLSSNNIYFSETDMLATFYMYPGHYSRQFCTQLYVHTYGNKICSLKTLEPVHLQLAGKTQNILMVHTFYHQLQWFLFLKQHSIHLVVRKRIASSGCYKLKLVVSRNRDNRGCKWDWKQLMYAKLFSICAMHEFLQFSRKEMLLPCWSERRGFALFHI